MTQQRQHAESQDVRIGSSDGSDNPAASTGRLATARQEADRLYAAADAVLNRIRQGNSQQFLDRMRQSGGQ